MRRCGACRRHIRATERACPFCGERARASSWRPARVSHLASARDLAAIVGVATTLVVTGCADRNVGSESGGSSDGSDSATTSDGGSSTTGASSLSTTGGSSASTTGPGTTTSAGETGTSVGTTTTTGSTGSGTTMATGSDSSTSGTTDGTGGSTGFGTWLPPYAGAAPDDEWPEGNRPPDSSDTE